MTYSVKGNPIGKGYWLMAHPPKGRIRLQLYPTQDMAQRAKIEKEQDD